MTYSSRLADGGKRDMILIAFNHRRIGNPGAIGAGLFNAYSRGRGVESDDVRVRT